MKNEHLLETHATKGSIKYVGNANDQDSCNVVQRTRSNLLMLMWMMITANVMHRVMKVGV